MSGAGTGSTAGDLFAIFGYYVSTYWYLWVPCAVLLAVWLVRGIRRGR